MTVDSVTKVASVGQTDQIDSEKSVFISSNCYELPIEAS